MVFARQPQPTLMEMPAHILEKIVQGVDDFEERHRIRSVSKQFKDTIDTLPLHLSSCSISIYPTSIEFMLTMKKCYTDISITYEDHLNGASIKRETNGISKNPDGKLTENENFWELAARDFYIILGNPKLKIDNFSVCSGSTDCFFKESFFQKLFGGKIFSKNSLKVKRFTPSCNGLNDPAVQLLKFLNPKFLKSINIQNVIPVGISENSEILNLGQWKMAKNLDIEMLEELISIEDLKNFENVNVGIDELKVEEFEKILEHFLTTSSIRCYRILCSEIDRTLLKPFLETDILKMNDKETFRREFKNVKFGVSPFAVTVYSNTIEFQRIVKH